MEIQVGDILKLKKPHPCGGKEFLVLRSGMDFKLRCTTCGRECMAPRLKMEKNVRSVRRADKPCTDAENRKDLRNGNV